MITNIAYDKSDVVQLLRTLDLYENKAQDPFFNRNVLNDFYSGKRHFTFVNVGNLDIKFGEMIRLIEDNYAGKTLRSAHTTDWSQIDNNNTGLLDYNNTVTRNGRYGTLMLHDQTETDNADLTSGDIIYLPGSMTINDKRVQRELFIWNNGKMQPCDIHQSYFLPACYIKEGNEFIHLIKYLKQKNRQLVNLVFNYESDAILDRIDEFVRYIRSFLDIILKTKDEFLIGNFFRRVVKAGTTCEPQFEYKDDKLILNGDVYTADELVNAILLPFKLAAVNDKTEPADFEHSTYPLLHNSLLILFFALNYNFPFFHEGKREVFRAHFHWGAIGMAGYPPNKKGYFKTASKTVKKFHSYLTDKKEAANLFFILIPILPFLFYADRREQNDFMLVSKLCAEVKEVPAGTETEVAQTLTQITTQWIEQYKSGLSAYFLSKFNKNRSILCDGQVFHRILECPDHLKNIEYNRISIVIGALFEYFNTND